MVALLVLNGSHAGSRFSLPDVPTVLGRSAEAHYRLDDPWVSNMHALFETRGAVTWVIDLDSRNGTFVGASRVHEAPLAVGEVVAFGRTEARVEADVIAPGATAPSPAPFAIDSIKTTVRTEALAPRPLAVLRLSLASSEGAEAEPPALALDTAAQVIMRRGGRTTPRLATDLLAVFGLGGAGPGDPARALHAASAILEKLEETSPAVGARIAVDFGPVVAGIVSGPDGTELVAGGELTDRLEQVLAEAARGEILVGPGVPASVDARLEELSRGGPGLSLRRLRRA